MQPEREVPCGVWADCGPFPTSPTDHPAVTPGSSHQVKVSGDVVLRVRDAQGGTLHTKLDTTCRRRICIKRASQDDPQEGDYYAQAHPGPSAWSLPLILEHFVRLPFVKKVLLYNRCCIDDFREHTRTTNCFQPYFSNTY